MVDEQLRILVVEDNPVFLRLLEKMLVEEDGHHVVTADNGLAALEILEGYRPDIIIVDWVMDKIDGEQFCKIVRSKPRLQKCYLIILSGMAAESQADLLTVGADACIAKGPFHETAGQIRYVLKESRCKTAPDFSKTILGLSSINQRQATVELLRRLKHYGLILQNMHDGVVVLAAGAAAATAEAGLPIIYANQAACALFGREEEVLLASRLPTYFNDGDRRRLTEILSGMKDEPVRIEDNQPLRLGDRYISAVFLPFVDGDELYATAVLRDITRQKEAEQALSKSEQQLQLALEAADLGMWDWDIPSGRVYFSPRYFAMLGYGPQELPHLLATWEKLVHPDDLPGTRQELQECLAREPAAWSLEFRMRCKNGTYRWIHSRGQVVQYGADGALLRAAGTHLDITERKQAEEAIHAEKSKLEAVVNALDTGLTMQDRNFVILYQNDQHKRLHGEHIGKICYEAFHGLAHVCPGCLLEKCFADGKSHHRETSRQRADGSQYLDVVASPCCDTNVAIIGCVETVKDITSRKMMEMQIQQAQKMEAIGTLAGGIAHDFNNILAAIMGYSEMAMMDAPAESSIHGMLQHVTTGAERARDLVKQILTFSRKTTQQKSPILLQVIVKEVMKLLRATIPSTITISADISPQCGTVVADPTMVHQLVMNLCTNSYHAMRQKGGLLSISLQPVDLAEEHTGSMLDIPAGAYVRLSVADTGHGMEKSVQQHIFDPYYTTKEKGQGTGLGLAVVHGIVHDLGGAITVTSDVGQGTTFDVFLPLSGNSHESEDMVSPVVRRGEGRILLVDDEVAITAVAARMLGRLGYQVTCFNSSRDALKAFIEAPQGFDLVISDQTMPEYTGLELIERIKKVAAGMPVLLMSGYSDQVDAESSRAMGLDGFLAKPFKDAEIARAVSDILGGAAEEGL